MSYNTKNYTEQGGEKTIIGGDLILTAGAHLTVDPAATIEGVPSTDLSAAAAQADSTASTIANLVIDFNSLLAKLRAAELLSS